MYVSATSVCSERIMMYPFVLKEATSRRLRERGEGGGGTGAGTRCSERCCIYMYR